MDLYEHNIIVITLANPMVVILISPIKDY